MKTFFVDSTGLVGRHKTRESHIVGYGIIHPDQKVVAYTNKGNVTSLHYEEMRIGSRKPVSKFLLSEGEEIVKIDIVTIGGTNES